MSDGTPGGIGTLGAALLAGLPLLAVSSVAATYLGLALAERRRRGWPAARTVGFLAGAAVVATALSPGVDRWADGDFSAHMAQHLLLAMVGPLGLVLGAPVALLLRSLPHAHARRLGRLLHAPVVRGLTRPVVALALSSGGLVVLYLTPLYELSTRHTGVHLLVHAHLLLSGALFAWVIAGPDPAPGRPGVRPRLVVLGAAVAVHASVAQLLYAGLLVQVHEPVVEMQAAGNLMYFGGDIAELLLAVALLVTWRPAPARPAYGRVGVSHGPQPSHHPGKSRTPGVLKHPGSSGVPG
jgi:putative membrane protein